jgi:transposase
MRLKDYGRKQTQRKEFVQNPKLLIIGIDISKNSHSACFGTNAMIVSKKFDFKNSREGFQKFESYIRTLCRKHACKQVLVGMEPSGLYWYGLFERLKKCGLSACLVNCMAVKNNRKTLPDGASKTDPKDAHSIYDLMVQGKFFLPVERDPELAAAYRLIRKHMFYKKRLSRIQNQIRGALHLSFPELNEEINDLAMPTSLRFLQSNPTPESVTRNGKKRFIQKWQPRRRCGQWRPEKFHKIYELARQSIGIKDPHRIDEFELKTMAQDLADAVAKKQLWIDKAVELLECRDDFQILLSMPRIGKPTAAALLTAIGDIDEYCCGKQIVKLAGLDIRLYESGTSIKKRPRVTHIGSGFLRHWSYHYALRLVAHDPHFQSLFERRKKSSPGKGAGQRALVAISDKILRIVYRMLKEQEPYSPAKDNVVAAVYQRTPELAA